jgi:hypothetical protein
MKGIPIAIVGCGIVSELYLLPVSQTMAEFNLAYWEDINEGDTRYINSKHHFPMVKRDPEV